MERTHTFLLQSKVRQFSDITNFKPNASHTDSFKHSLRTSYVQEANYEPRSKRSSSKDKNCLKGLIKYDKNDRSIDSPFATPYEPNQNLRPSSKQYQQNDFSSKPLFRSDQLYSTANGQSSLTVKKQNQASFSRSMKASTVRASSQIQQIGSNVQKQNNIATLSRHIEREKSKDKQKFNFRESLGSLSKQIKNTLKFTPNNETFQNNVKPCQKQGYNNELKKNYPIQKPRPTSNIGEGEEAYVRYQKTPSFLLNAEIGRIKRPAYLDFKPNNLVTNKEKVQEKQSKIEYKKSQFIQKSQRNSKYGTEKNPLGRSTVTSTIFNNEPSLKYSSVMEPLTPQLRTTKKYDSYNFEKQHRKTSVYDSTGSLKPDLNKIQLHSKTLSGFGTPKTSSLHFSSVVESSSRFSQENKDRLSEKQRSSFGQELTLNDFHLGSVKGEGRFGKFYPAIHKKSGMLVGIKEIKKESLKNMLDQFIQELKIQSFIEHPNIVKLYGYFCSKQNFYLILEYMQEGSLFSFIKKSKKIQQEDASTKLKQICTAVEYLHENEILHRDIKPQNIVMTCDVCKLCDFGWAVYTSTRRKTYCGTLDYVCPQILQGDSYDSCVDIWAIGVLAFEMIVGKAPFYNISRKQTMKKIMECNFDLPKQLSTRAKQFISKALNKNPNERESVAGLGKHEFLN